MYPLRTTSLANRLCPVASLIKYKVQKLFLLPRHLRSRLSLGFCPGQPSLPGCASWALQPPAFPAPSRAGAMHCDPGPNSPAEPKPEGPASGCCCCGSLRAGTAGAWGTRGAPTPWMLGAAGPAAPRLFWSLWLLTPSKRARGVSCVHFHVNYGSLGESLCFHLREDYCSHRTKSLCSLHPCKSGVNPFKPLGPPWAYPDINGRTINKTSV